MGAPGAAEAFISVALRCAMPSKNFWMGTITAASSATAARDDRVQATRNASRHIKRFLIAVVFIGLSLHRCDGHWSRLDHEITQASYSPSKRRVSREQRICLQAGMRLGCCSERFRRRVRPNSCNHCRRTASSNAVLENRR